MIEITTDITSLGETSDSVLLTNQPEVPRKIRSVNCFDCGSCFSEQKYYDQHIKLNRCKKITLYQTPATHSKLCETDRKSSMCADFSSSSVLEEESKRTQNKIPNTDCEGLSLSEISEKGNELYKGKGSYLCPVCGKYFKYWKCFEKHQDNPTSQCYKTSSVDENLERVGQFAKRRTLNLDYKDISLCQISNKRTKVDTRKERYPYSNWGQNFVYQKTLGNHQSGLSSICYKPSKIKENPDVSELAEDNIFTADHKYPSERSGKETYLTGKNMSEYCSTCGKVFRYIKCLRRHQAICKVKKASESVIDVLKNKTFGIDVKDISSLEVIGEKELGTVDCKYQKPNELLKAKKICNRRTVQCKICSIWFKSESNLEKHLELALCKGNLHLKNLSKEKPHRCYVCGMGYLYRKNLFRHIRRSWCKAGYVDTNGKPKILERLRPGRHTADFGDSNGRLKILEEVMESRCNNDCVKSNGDQNLLGQISKGKCYTCPYCLQGFFNVSNLNKHYNLKRCKCRQDLEVLKHPHKFEKFQETLEQRYLNCKDFGPLSCKRLRRLLHKLNDGYKTVESLSQNPKQVSEILNDGALKETSSSKLSHRWEPNQNQFESGGSCFKIEMGEVNELCILQSNHEAENLSQNPKQVSEIINEGVLKEPSSLELSHRWEHNQNQLESGGSCFKIEMGEVNEFCISQSNHESEFPIIADVIKEEFEKVQISNVNEHTDFSVKEEFEEFHEPILETHKDEGYYTHCQESDISQVSVKEEVDETCESQCLAHKCKSIIASVDGACKPGLQADGWETRRHQKRNVNKISGFDTHVYVSPIHNPKISRNRVCLLKENTHSSQVCKSKFDVNEFIEPRIYESQSFELENEVNQELNSRSYSRPESQLMSMTKKKCAVYGVDRCNTSNDLPAEGVKSLEVRGNEKINVLSVNISAGSSTHVPLNELDKRQYSLVNEEVKFPITKEKSAIHVCQRDSLLETFKPKSDIYQVSVIDVREANVPESTIDNNQSGGESQVCDEKEGQSFDSGSDMKGKSYLNDTGNQRLKSNIEVAEICEVDVKKEPQCGVTLEKFYPDRGQVCESRDANQNCAQIQYNQMKAIPNEKETFHDSLAQEIRVIDQSPSEPCSQVKKALKSTFDIKKVKRMPQNCKFCGKNFFSKSNLNKHHRLNRCKVMMAHPTLLHRVQKEFLPENVRTKEKVACADCGTLFLKEKYLIQHKKLNRCQILYKHGSLDNESLTAESNIMKIVLTQKSLATEDEASENEPLSNNVGGDSSHCINFPGTSKLGECSSMLLNQNKLESPNLKERFGILSCIEKDEQRDVPFTIEGKVLSSDHLVSDKIHLLKEYENNKSLRKVRIMKLCKEMDIHNKNEQKTNLQDENKNKQKQIREVESLQGNEGETKWNGVHSFYNQVGPDSSFFFRRTLRDEAVTCADCGMIFLKKKYLYQHMKSGKCNISPSSTSLLPVDPNCTKKNALSFAPDKSLPSFLARINKRKFALSVWSYANDILGKKSHASKCQFCGREFFHKKNLYRHIRLKRCKLVHRCPFCDVHFFNNKSINELLNDKLTLNTQSSRDSLNDHDEKRKCSNDHDYSQASSLSKNCNDEETSSSTGVVPNFTKENYNEAWFDEKNSDSVNENQIFIVNVSCPSCKRDFSSEYKRMPHFQDNLCKSVHCSLCNTKFSNAYVLDFHMKFFHSNRNCLCKTCNKDLEGYSDLEVFLLMNKVKPLNCPLCDGKFSRHSSLMKHVQIHLRECNQKHLFNNESKLLF